MLKVFIIAFIIGFGIIIYATAKLLYTYFKPHVSNTKITSFNTLMNRLTSGWKLPKTKIMSDLSQIPQVVVKFYPEKNRFKIITELVDDVYLSKTMGFWYFSFVDSKKSVNSDIENMMKYIMVKYCQKIIPSIEDSLDVTLTGTFKPFKIKEQL